MDKKLYLLATAMLTLSGSAIAQDTGESVNLLPDNVITNISSKRVMAKDKNLVVAGSPEKGYKAFFAATEKKGSEQYGEELWVTDGTPEGTHIVKDINPGTASSNPVWISRLNDKVLFGATDENGDQGIWVSDGTEEGTKMIYKTNDMGEDDPMFFCQVNETQAVFAAVNVDGMQMSDDEKPHFVYVTDGTEEGTKLISDKVNWIASADDNNQHAPFVRVGRKVFFQGKDIDNLYGEEPWVTDGTEEGTHMVKDCRTDPDKKNPGHTLGAHLNNFENYKNKLLFFTCYTNATGHEVWRSDGTEEGTYLVKDFNPKKNPTNGEGAGNGAFAPSLEVYKDCILFRGTDGSNAGMELASANLETNEMKLYDVWPGTSTNDKGQQVANESFPDPGAVFDGVYIFCAADGFDANGDKNYNHGGEQRIFDGEKVTLQKDFCPGTLCDWVKEPIVANGSLYWYNEGNDVAQGFGSGLYRLDSKDATPVVCTRVTADGDFANTLRNLDGNILWVSNSKDAKYQQKLFCYKYQKSGWDGKTDKGILEPVFDTTSNGITDIAAKNNTGKANVYTIDGVLVRSNVPAISATDGLAKGLYIVGNKKVAVK